MRNFKYIWAVGLAVTLILVIAPIVVFAPPQDRPTDDPWAHVPTRPEHTDHTYLLEGPFASGQEVTQACLECHPDAAQQVMGTSHWTWTSEPVEVSWSDQPVSTGKANLLNNFCIGVQSNWTECTRCHAGYGWEDAEFDFSEETAVDCLVCHAQPGTYAKSDAGLPAEGIDLLAAAQSVGTPTRANCGTCHFYGGSGDGAKHGDLDSSMADPADDQDVHMGALDFQCVDCHQAEDHAISGRSISVSVDSANGIACSDCHSADLHTDERLDLHTDTVACQTCHIPEFATRLPTRMAWDWSTAGNLWPEDPRAYLRSRGSYEYDNNIVPEYLWFNGEVAYRYLMGDPVDPLGVTALNPPAGSIDDPNALIYPFKVFEGNQPYDAVFRYLLQPHTVGEDGYFAIFDWDQALRLGAEATGVPYSGEYGFARTTMYWEITHMVVPANQALECAQCHSENGLLDWQALGYPGDPMEWGSR